MHGARPPWQEQGGLLLLSLALLLLTRHSLVAAGSERPEKAPWEGRRQSPPVDGEQAGRVLLEGGWAKPLVAKKKPKMLTLGAAGKKEAEEDFARRVQESNREDVDAQQPESEGEEGEDAVQSGGDAEGMDYRIGIEEDTGDEGLFGTAEIEEAALKPRVVPKAVPRSGKKKMAGKGKAVSKGKGKKGLGKKGGKARGRPAAMDEPSEEAEAETSDLGEEVAAAEEAEGKQGKEPVRGEGRGKEGLSAEEEEPEAEELEEPPEDVEGMAKEEGGGGGGGVQKAADSARKEGPAGRIEEAALPEKRVGQPQEALVQVEEGAGGEEGGEGSAEQSEEDKKVLAVEGLPGLPSKRKGRVQRGESDEEGAEADAVGGDGKVGKEGEGGRRKPGRRSRARHQRGAAASKVAMANRTECVPEDFEKLRSFKGRWLPHEDENYVGHYIQATDCPAWASDFDCFASGAGSNRSDGMAAYNQVFQPHKCKLREWDSPVFERCMEGRRILITHHNHLQIGDSMQRQLFQSLACLLHKAGALKEGVLGSWEEHGPKVLKEHPSRGLGSSEEKVALQYAGKMVLNNGVEVHLRCFSSFSGPLWDEVVTPFLPFSNRDLIVVNWGAWSPKYSSYNPLAPWEGWKADTEELFVTRLSKYEATTFYRTYAATHFGGSNGTITYAPGQLEQLELRGSCPPTVAGEYWYDAFVKTLLKRCGLRCQRIRLMPVFDLTLAMHASHHGSFGRKVGMLDCRHYCSNVIDTWSTVLFNMLC